VGPWDRGRPIRAGVGIRLGAAFAARGGVFVKIFSLARVNRTPLVVTAFLFSLAVHHRRGNVRRDCDVAGRCVRPSVGGWPALRILRRLGPERGRKESEEKLLEGSVRAPHVIEPQQSLFGFFFFEEEFVWILNYKKAARFPRWKKRK